ncbi:unnamed protein product [Onchocerca ochengi]|uniref:Uncharacterized protein n=1 Tax=Onchocerca ochengi TaxID=42157 RepID=A0A182EQN5_ONCOC|nr:unnamed protein product [Onchocerca ochengi]
MRQEIQADKYDNEITGLTDVMIGGPTQLKPVVSEETSKRSAAEWCGKLEERRAVKYTPLLPPSASFYHLTNERTRMGGASAPSIHRNLHCFHASCRDVDVDGVDGSMMSMSMSMPTMSNAGATDRCLTRCASLACSVLEFSSNSSI